MALDINTLEHLLCKSLCTNLRVSQRDDGVIMLDTPFTFPDGDSFPIYLDETGVGGVRLSDRGHTLMHMSYEHDIDSIYNGPRAVLREQIVSEYEIQEDNGSFVVETSPDKIADSLFRFGQALTKIYDLTFLSREQMSSTFYEGLTSLLSGIVNEDRIVQNYIPLDVPDGESYPVDYKLDGRNDSPVFVYGVAGRDKARLTTIMLSHFLLNNLDFDSVIVFENQQKIPRLDLARLTNVAGPAVASLDAKLDIKRKIKRLAA